VLDAGTGVGSLLPALADAAPRATVFGIDFSPGMLRLAPAGFPLAVMDLERPALAAERFDVAIAAFMLFHLADPAEGVATLHRVLRPGGSLGTVTWDGEPRFPAQLAWSRALDEAGAPPGGTLLNHEPLSSRARVEALLKRAGFATLRTWTAPFEYDYGAEGFLRERMCRGTSRKRFAALSPQVRDALLERLRTRFAAMRPGDFVDRSEMIFAVATRS
jgi:SAM-dependent methyltransferase